MKIITITRLPLYRVTRGNKSYTYVSARVALRRYCREQLNERYPWKFDYNEMYDPWKCPTRPDMDWRKRNRIIDRFVRRYIKAFRKTTDAAIEMGGER